MKHSHPNKSLRVASSQSQESVDRRGIFDGLGISKSEMIGYGAAALVAIGGIVAVVSNKIDNSKSDASKNSRAIMKKNTAIAEDYVRKLHANGEEYTVTIQTGGSADQVLRDNEPQVNNGSVALRAAELEDIAGQATHDGQFWPGDKVSVADVPDDIVKAPGEKPHPGASPNQLAPPK